MAILQIWEPAVLALHGPPHSLGIELTLNLPSSVTIAGWAKIWVTYFKISYLERFNFYVLFFSFDACWNQKFGNHFEKI